MGGRSAGLRLPEQFAGYLGEPEVPRHVILRHNGLHIEVMLDAGTGSGRERSGAYLRRLTGSGGRQ